MDTRKLKRFATEARTILMQGVKNRLHIMRIAKYSECNNCLHALANEQIGFNLENCVIVYDKCGLLLSKIK